MAEQLNRSVTVTASAAGAASATLGPDSGKGAPAWRVIRYAVRNETVARRGQPPIPTCNVYAPSSGQEDPDAWLDGTYDGSFDAGDCDVSLSRGQVFLAVWAGAQAGDKLTLSLTGEVTR
jgi:hypothetical protein